MPPKSGAGDKKKQEAEEFELQEKLKQVAARIESLEREILMKTEENARLISEIRIFEAQVKQLSSDIERERADRHDVAVDMTRQFKSMQDELLKDIIDRKGDRSCPCAKCQGEDSVRVGPTRAGRAYPA